MSLVVRVCWDTGLLSVSLTQSAAGSPVITGMVRPLPGRSMRCASCMIAELLSVFAQISLETEEGRVMEVLLMPSAMFFLLV